MISRSYKGRAMRLIAYTEVLGFRLTNLIFSELYIISGFQFVFVPRKPKFACLLFLSFGTNGLPNATQVVAITMARFVLFSSWHSS
jgi:hypothetical protein